MKTNTIILGVILLLLVGGISFGVGYKVAEAKTAVTSFARNGALRNGNQTIGEIISLDDKSVTVKMADGSSKIVLLSSTMTISKSIDAPKTDLKVGSKVAVFGTNNSDGSQTATSIELDPRMLNLTSTPQR